MTKYINDDLLDLALQALEDEADKLTLCVGAPTTYAEATDVISGGGKRCAEVTIDSSDFTGPADHSPDGRETVVAAQTSLTIDEDTGSPGADHVALVDVSATKLLAVTSLASALDMTAGNAVNTTAFTFSLPDAV